MKIERELENAKGELKAFGEGNDGQWLTELKEKLRKKEYKDEAEKEVGLWCRW